MDYSDVMFILFYLPIAMILSGLSVHLSKKIMNKIELNVPFAFLGATIATIAILLPLYMIYQSASSSSSSDAYSYIIWGAILSAFIPLLFGSLLYPKNKEEKLSGSMAVGAFSMVYIFPALLLTVRVS